MPALAAAVTPVALGTLAAMLALLAGRLRFGRRMREEPGEVQGRSHRAADQGYRAGGDHHEEDQLGFLAGSAFLAGRNGGVGSLLLVVLLV
ncbi:MAG: hypothetical protein EBT97_05190 [Actinobacteria bacterium]|nr:hypothetical protein [Actinomycetota bacterium]